MQDVERGTLARRSPRLNASSANLSQQMAELTPLISSSQHQQRNKFALPSPRTNSSGQTHSIRSLVLMLMVVATLAGAFVLVTHFSGNHHSWAAFYPTSSLYEYVRAASDDISPSTDELLISTETPILTSLSDSRHYDSLEQIISCPPLAGILEANSIRVIDSSRSDRTANLSSDSVTAARTTYNEALAKRLSSDRLKFLDWRTEQSKPVTMKDKLASGPFVTNSSRNADYSIQTWENVCLTFGHKGDPTLIFVGDPQRHNQIIDSILKPPVKLPYHWLPYRWHNDQGKLRTQDKPDDDWIFIPSVPSDGIGVIQRKYELPGASQIPSTFHTFEWDFNVGHQFHQQIWPMFQALHSSASYNTPNVQSLLIDNGCADPKSSMGIRHGAWKPINQFFARLVMSAAEDRVRILRQTCTDEPKWPSGVCFERLTTNDPSDQYLEKSVASPAGFGHFREVILNALQFKPDDNRAANEPLNRPLRVTIYSRQDSERRRILNIDEITKALSPYHIVRHTPNFGRRPPAEQLALYANTDLLITPHGAHMTFTFLMPKNSIIVECFAQQEGIFSWTVNFLKSTEHDHIIQAAIPRSEDIPLTNDFRAMDRDMDVNMTALCLSLKHRSIPIDYTC